jgi:hypothetical protein
MRTPTDDEIAGCLIAIISDGFNRSLGALEAARAVDTRKMRGHYKGVGSKYYDLVTEQTAKNAVPAILQLLEAHGGPRSASPSGFAP